MKTILSLVSAATLLGLITLAVAESKSAKSAMPSSASPSETVAVNTAGPETTAPAKPARCAKNAPKPSMEPSMEPSVESSSNAVPASAPKSRSVGKTASPAKASPAKATADSRPAASPKAPAKEKEKAENPLTPAQEDKLLVLLNEGTVEELDAIPGVAATRADSIISARPFASVHEIILVEGVGSATFEKILAHGKSLTRRSAPEAGTRES